jgi:hypothetical protein
MNIANTLKKTLFLVRSLDDFENYRIPGIDYPVIANTASEVIAKKYPKVILHQNISRTFDFYDTTFFSETLYNKNKIETLSFDHVWMHRAYPWLDDLKTLGKKVFAIDFPLYEQLNNKFTQYELLSKYCDTQNLSNFIQSKIDRFGTRFYYKDPGGFKDLTKTHGLPFVMAGSLSDSGNHVFFINNEAEYKKSLFKIPGPVIRIERFITDALPLSQFAVVFADANVVCYQPSVQFITNATQPNNFEFVGSEYNIDGLITTKIKEELVRTTRRIGKFLCSKGYLGMFGCDYILSHKHIYFMELNPRYHASTFLINRCADFQSAPHTIHMQAFLLDKKPMNIKDNYLDILKEGDMTGFIRFFRKITRKNTRTPGKDIVIPHGLFNGYELFHNNIIESPYFPARLNIKVS